MQLINVEDLGVTVELFPDDCLAIADALAHWGDRPGNIPHIKALQTAFRACAILAASDTNMDARPRPTSGSGRRGRCGRTWTRP